MISEIRVHFKSIAIGKWAEVTNSNCGEAAVVRERNRKHTQVDASSFLVHS